MPVSPERSSVSTECCSTSGPLTESNRSPARPSSQAAASPPASQARMQRNMDHPRASWSCSAADEDPDWEIVSNVSSSCPSSDCRRTKGTPRATDSVSHQQGLDAATVFGASSPVHDNNDAVVPPPRHIATIVSSYDLTMPGWKDEYLSSLLEAERNNPVNFDLVEACTFVCSVSPLASLLACLLPPPPHPQTLLSRGGRLPRHKGNHALTHEQAPTSTTE